MTIRNPKHDERQPKPSVISSIPPTGILILKRHLLLTLLGLSLSTPLLAHAEGLYLGGNFGGAEQKIRVNPFGSAKSSDTGYKLYGGYGLNKNFGVEAGFVDFGSAGKSFSGGAANLDARSKSLYVAGVGTLPVTDKFSVFAKAGVAATRTELSVRTPGAGANGTYAKTTPMFGIGAAYNFTNRVALKAEYENFGKVVDRDASSVKAHLLSVGLRYQF